MTDAVPLLSNAELARIFHEIGNILEIQGELVYKTVAYHRAADAIAHSPVELARAYRTGDPPRIPGVGDAIAKKLRELAMTGTLEFHDRLRRDVPASLVALLEVPGVGPKTVRILRETLGVESLEDLRQAATAGTLRGLRGMSEKTEESILAGIASLERRSGRMRLGAAAGHVERLVKELRDVEGVVSLQPAGSFRRRRETIGDLDLLAETTDPAALIARFTAMPDVQRVIGAGIHKASVELRDGPQVDLMVFPPGELGTYLIHFTGSRDHNVKLRGRARDRGWSLSEKGYLRLPADGADGAGSFHIDEAEGPGGATDPSAEPAGQDAAELRTFASEAAAYEFLDLPYIEPELREDRGEIEAALAGKLPDLVRPSDLRGDCHTHSDWSDGVHTIEQMAEAARRRGYAWQVLTDHSVSLAIARGLSVERVAEQRAIVASLNERFAREDAEGGAPEGTSSDGFRLLHGCELEIRADATLDFPDELLAQFDVVVASLHVARKQPREQLMARVLAALRSPHVDILGHPAGRYVDSRADLDLDWDVLFAEAARTGTLLEIDGADERLDLSDVRARRAVEAGCLLVIDSDAHRIEELDNVGWGVSVARRGWVEARSVVNTRSRQEFLAWLAAKPSRLSS